MPTTSRAPDPRRRNLDRELLAWMNEPEWKHDDARFDRLARASFEFQFEHCAPYRAFCTARGVTPENLGSWREIPALPTSAFKETRLCSFPPDLTLETFHTSGTSTATRGALHLDTLELYHASLAPTLRRFLFPDRVTESGVSSMSIRILAPSPDAAPDSSLSHMFGRLLEDLGNADSGYDVVDAELRVGPLIERLRRACDQDEAIALCGTAFAFVHLLDALEAQAGLAIELPAGSRLMETGGFKGRSREIPREDLYDELESALGIARPFIVNQYGMTELGSQFYDSTLREAVLGGETQERRKLGPPWTRVRVLDPETGRDAGPGEVGMIVIHDLANSGSISCLASADLGRVIRTGDANRDGFEVLGRAVVADERGCSIAADALLSGASS